MNVRSIVISTPPMFSTHAGFSRVSLPCEPWNTPDQPVAKPLNQSVAATIRRDDAQMKITTALKAGNERFERIATAAFGKRSGPVDDLTRLVLSKMLDAGLVSRSRASSPGLPFIWKLTDA
jgi:hypothetical protein